MRYFQDPSNDYLMVVGKREGYPARQPLNMLLAPGNKLHTARAACIEGDPSSVCTCEVSGYFLSRCTQVKASRVPDEWWEAIHQKKRPSRREEK